MKDVGLEQQQALHWGVLALESLDHDCKRSPDDGCAVCDNLLILRGMMNQPKETPWNAQNAEQI